jgi:hypothetical protein
MITILREVQHVYPDKWADLEIINQEFNILEARLGFPPKKRYQVLSGPEEYQTLIIEYQWESMAVMEATFEKAYADPDYQKLMAKSFSILRDNRVEMLMPLP